MKDKTIKKYEVFNKEVYEVAGLKLRALSAGSMMLLKIVDNKLLDGKNDDNDNMMEDIVEFLFLHSVDIPLNELRELVSNKKEYDAKLFEFASSVPMHVLVTAANEIGKIINEQFIGADYTVKDDTSKKA